MSDAAGKGVDPRHLLLWDIDGTLLLRASESHARAMLAAIGEVHGLEREMLRSGAGRAGMTDGQIGRELLLAAGVDPADVDRLQAEVMARTCAAYVPEDLTERVNPGVDAVLAAMHDRDDVAQSLVTGNYEPVARRKLAAAGLDRWLDPRWGGGFGSDHEDRVELPAIARRRAGEALGTDPWPVERTIVIGDTPRDVDCARHDGCGVIAIATGPHDAADLSGADAVAADAGELGELLAARLAG